MIGLTAFPLSFCRMTTGRVPVCSQPNESERSHSQMSPRLMGISVRLHRRFLTTRRLSRPVKNHDRNSFYSNPLAGFAFTVQLPGKEPPFLPGLSADSLPASMPSAGGRRTAKSANLHRFSARRSPPSSAAFSRYPFRFLDFIPN